MLNVGMLNVGCACSGVALISAVKAGFAGLDG